MYSFLNPYLTALMNLLKTIFGSYGLAIVIITIIIRCCLMPLQIAANRQRIIQQNKIVLIQPEVRKFINHKKHDHTLKERRQDNKRILGVYQKNHVHMFLRSLTVLNLLIQWPIVTVMYIAFRYTPNVNKAMFNWGPLGKLPLGKSNTLLFLAVTLAYLIATVASLYLIPTVKRGNIKFMSFVPTLIISFFSLISSAGIQLYLIISGISLCIIDCYSAKHYDIYRKTAKKELK